MKIKNLIALVSLAFLISFSASALEPVNHDRSNNTSRHNNQNKYNKNKNKHRGIVGAPLDGGLLTILGAAGVIYFTARRKKKNGEEV